MKKFSSRKLTKDTRILFLVIHHPVKMDIIITKLYTIETVSKNKIASSLSTEENYISINKR